MLSKITDSISDAYTTMATAKPVFCTTVSELNV